jgi:hypothetical protein
MTPVSHRGTPRVALRAAPTKSKEGPDIAAWLTHRFRLRALFALDVREQGVGELVGLLQKKVGHLVLPPQQILPTHIAC